MSVIRPLQAADIFAFNAVNADAWTATYHTGYYAAYLARWPDFCVVAEGAFDSQVKAYMIGKHEPPAPDPQHHGHLTALSIAPQYRALGLARVFMDILERLSSDGTAGNVDSSRRVSPSETVAPAKLGADEANGADPSAPASPSADDAGRARDCADAWFVDLFVRCNNHRAIDMYEKLGYSVYRRVVDYYHGMDGVGSGRDELDGYGASPLLPSEDIRDARRLTAADMRKSMPRDKDKRYTRANGKDILVSPDQVWA